MKTLFLLLTLIPAQIIAGGIEYHSILIKWKHTSNILKEWNNAGRHGQIQAMNSILGTHNTRPYLRDAIIKAIEKQDIYLSLKRPNSSAIPPHKNLSALCIVELQQPFLHKAQLIAKLNTLPQIEYAEELPVHVFTEMPNDPLITLQTYLAAIKAYDAWNIWSTLPAGPPVLMGIVDTGVDPLHEDLLPAMYVNPGEDGSDEKGNSKRDNGIDDDNNGFIDDWRGWDFVSSEDPVKGDNKPFPGHFHGTHVAGIAAAITNNAKGIAGIGRNVKILPVKIGRDDSNSLSVESGYEGLLYAAAMGARIINCSWGSPSSSQAEAEIVATAQRYGALIIGGAGNDGQNTPYYPAAYPDVICVGATDLAGYRAYYSNYGSELDLCAPGSQIYSTITGGNAYGYSTGTSMSAPVIAGCAAIIAQIFPDYNARQIIAQLQATAQKIDTLNPALIGKLGSGLVDLGAAANQRNARYAFFTQKDALDNDKDGMYAPGEKISISLVLQNMLAPLKNAYVFAGQLDTSFVKVGFVKSELQAGALATGLLYAVPGTIEFILPENSPYNYPLEIALFIVDGADTIARDILRITINPTYRTLSSNRLTFTVNSRGNLGYNDYPRNGQGQGFMLDSSASMLFEGGLIAGISPEKLSNVVRDVDGEAQDMAFALQQAVYTKIPGVLALAEAYTTYADSNRADQAGLAIQHSVYQLGGNANASAILSYQIQNVSGQDYDSVYAGLFFDWDIGPAGQNNICGFDNNKGYAYCFNASDSALPRVGISLLTAQPLNYYAIDNDGGGGEIGIYNGFTRREKWRALASGVARRFSNATDASMVFGAGPFSLAINEKKQVAFLLAAGKNQQGLDSALINGAAYAQEKGIASGFSWNKLPVASGLQSVMIGRDQAAYITYGIARKSEVWLEVFDILGAIKRSIPMGMQQPGIYQQQRISFNALPSGLYCVRLRTSFNNDVVSLVLVR
jgi:hypothetical protein